MLGSRTLRNAFRQGVTDLTSIGIPASKIGIFLGFHTNPGQGGREQLKPASAWFDTIKWQVLAIEQVSREIPLATIWSWGWGEWAAADRDPDKPAAACVYLWTRNHSLCSGPTMAGRKFDTSLTEGQLILPGRIAVQDPVGPARKLAALERRARHRRPRDRVHVALRPARPEERGAGQAAGPARRRTGDRPLPIRRQRRRLPRRAGPRRRLDRDRARRDLRRAPAGADRAQLPGQGSRGEGRSRATARAMRRPRLASSRSTPAPAWLGHRSRGVAIDGLAPASVFRISGHGWSRVKTRDGVLRVRALSPTAPLGAFSLADSWSSIRAALVRDRSGLGLRQLAHAPRVGARCSGRRAGRTGCRAVGPLELTTELPFLALAS